MKLCECGCGEPAPIATKTYRKWGHVKGEPMRFVRGHSTRHRGPRWEVRDAGYRTPCWIWLLRLRNGYGITWDGERLASAHRVEYERRFGVLDPALTLDHLCRNRACVNPEHLEPVTNTENVRRGAATKLTWGEVCQIREALEAGSPLAPLARKYGVTMPNLSQIRLGKTWREEAEA